MVWLSKKVDCFVPQVFFSSSIVLSRHEFLTVNLIPNFLCRFGFRISADDTSWGGGGISNFGCNWLALFLIKRIATAVALVRLEILGGGG